MLNGKQLLGVISVGAIKAMRVNAVGNSDGQTLGSTALLLSNGLKWQF